MGWAQAVAFINPGHPDEPYWRTVSESMNAAARSLGVPLEEYFVRREHVRSFEIARTIVALGHTLGLTVLAEGVETPAQQELLRQLGCDMVQGFLVSRPLDAQQTLEWLSRPQSAVTSDAPGRGQ
mgnify:CR=1 FL=1